MALFLTFQYKGYRRASLAENPVLFYLFIFEIHASVFINKREFGNKLDPRTTKKR